MIELSIVIPMYKGKRYIVETVESLRKINCNKEIIIVDDGSPDDSYAYCCKIFESYNDVVILQKKNGGIVEARNFGVEYAKGSYILFSDQDDVCFSNTIEKALLQAQNNHADVALWSTVYLLPNGKYEPRDIVYSSGLFYESDIKNIFVKDMVLNIDNREVSYLGHVWQGLYKKSLVKNNKIRFKRFIDIEDDYLFLFDALCASSCIITLEDVGYAWRYNRASETYRMKHIDGLIAKYESFYKYIWNIIKQYPFAQEIETPFLTYTKQETMIRGMENSYTYISHSSCEKKQLRTFYSENLRYFQVEAVYKYEKKRARIFWLLKKRMYYLAVSYVYLDSLRRKIKSFIN